MFLNQPQRYRPPRLLPVSGLDMLFSSHPISSHAHMLPSQAKPRGVAARGWRRATSTGCARTAPAGCREHSASRLAVETAVVVVVIVIVTVVVRRCWWRWRWRWGGGAVAAGRGGPGPDGLGGAGRAGRGGGGGHLWDVAPVERQQGPERGLQALF